MEMKLIRLVVRRCLEKCMSEHRIGMNWISCDVSLPPECEEVLVWVIYGSGCVDYTDSWLVDGIWANLSAKNFKVTHWMKIKEPVRVK